MYREGLTRLVMVFSFRPARLRAETRGRGLHSSKVPAPLLPRGPRVYTRLARIQGARAGQDRPGGLPPRTRAHQPDASRNGAKARSGLAGAVSGGELTCGDENY
jgi:hypothetical protein